MGVATLCTLWVGMGFGYVLAERIACSEDAVAVVARVARVRHVLQGYNSCSNHTKQHRVEPNQTILSKKTKPNQAREKQSKSNTSKRNPQTKLHQAKPKHIYPNHTK